MPDARRNSGYTKSAPAAPTITAAPTAKLTYDQPRVSTTNGQTGIATPYAGGNPTPITAPSYLSGGAPPRYSAPAPIQRAAAAPAPMPAPAPPPPPPPPAPPVGGRTWYNGLDAGAKGAQDQSWLAGDSDYTAQVAEYDKALQAFVDRIAGQKKMFNQDADDAIVSTGRNQNMSLDNLGEDFGARGLAYSGLFDQTKNQTNERFNEAKGNVEKVRGRNLMDASNRETDYRAENEISKGNANRASLARQAQRQALLDSMAGF